MSLKLVFKLDKVVCDLCGYNVQEFAIGDLFQAGKHDNISLDHSIYASTFCDLSVLSCTSVPPCTFPRKAQIKSCVGQQVGIPLIAAANSTDQGSPIQCIDNRQSSKHLLLNVASNLRFSLYFKKHLVFPPKDEEPI